MWLRTVSRLKCSSWAIWSVDRPCSSSRSTSVCRGVKRVVCGARLEAHFGLYLAEDADHRVAAYQPNGVELDEHAIAALVQDEAPRLRRSS